MKMKRRITVFVATFAVVMIGGAALAAVGVVSPPTSSPTSNIAAAATEPEAALTSPAISTSPDALTPADTQPRLDIRLDASDLVPVHEFTAHQRYEVVDGWPVVNYYWGTAKPGAELHIGSEYGRGTTATNDDGKWEIRVEFPTAPCNEPFRVAAESGDHRKEFKMTRACEVDVVLDFTAHQKYGECSEDVPYDVFWGTAAAGATITVESPHGRASTAAGEKGHWELKVEFPDAPVGEVFDVVVESSDGGRSVFSFVNVGQES